MLWLIRLSFVLGVLSAEEGSSTGDYVISHSFDGIHFTPRQGFNFNQLPLETRENGVDQQYVDKFKELLKYNGFYTIQINFQQKNLSSIPISASIRACDLQKSGFKEDISLHTNRDNNIVGVQYTSPVIALPRPCDPNKIPSGKFNFQTKVKLREPVTSQVIPIQVNGPRPPYLQNVNLGVEDLAQEKKPQSQSFFMKYWYIIVPVLLMTLLSGGGDPPPGEGAAAGAPAGATAASK